MTATDTESAFLAAIVANPANDLRRLVYADWLDEQAGGYDPRAEFIRCQVELANGCDPWCRNGVVQQSIQEYRANAGHVVTVGQQDVPCPKCGPLRRCERELSAHAIGWLGLSVPVHTGFGTPPPGTVGVVATRGFVSHVTASYETLFGGQCGWCDGRGEERVADAAGDMDDIECRCHGTGRTVGIAAGLFRSQPIEGVTLTGVVPYPSITGDRFAWWNDGRSSHAGDFPDSDIPTELYTLIESPDICPDRKSFPTRESALTALSAAAVRLGRQRAGIEVTW